MDQEKLQKYAELIVKKGLNPEPGQGVVIMAAPENAAFVHQVVELCYQQGAGKVYVNYEDMALSRLAQLHESEESLARLYPWEKALWQYRVDELPCLLWLDSDDPDGMAGIDQNKRARAQMKKFPEIKPFRAAMENKFQWCIAGVPSVKWAQKVFPGVPEAEAVEKLWQAILSAARAEGDPIANWETHNQNIHRRADKLNSLHLKSLEYHSSNGTNFKVGLIDQGIFAGGEEKDLSGRRFNPNIPSEEIFTSPCKGQAEGVLCATKPLSWQGSLIEDFSFRFEHGKVVEVHARKGQEALEKMVAMDENAPYLGECALISCNSPINRSGILFYSTLYDENASCHFALGRGFDNCIRDYDKYTTAQIRALGVNDSMIHVDFMVGSDDMAIDGITATGERVEIFRNGDWCF